jgi:hypothetical protein
MNVSELKAKSVGTFFKQPFKILLIAHNRKNGGDIYIFVVLVCSDKNLRRYLKGNHLS